MITLKPCPFCGGAAYVRAYHLEPGSFVAGCVHTCAADPEMCGVMPHTFPMVTKAAAAKAWNERGAGEPKIRYWQGKPESDIAEKMQRLAFELWGLSLKTENPELAGFLDDASSILQRVAGSSTKPLRTSAASPSVGAGGTRPTRKLAANRQ